MGLSYDLHIDQALTNFACGYGIGEAIGSIVCPDVPVNDDAGQFTVWGSEALKPTDTLRSDKSESNEVVLNASHDHYACNPHGLHHDISEKDIKHSKQPLDLIYTRDLLNRMIMAQEKEIADLFTTYTNYGTGYGSVAGYHTCSPDEQLNQDGGVADIISLIRTAKIWVWKSCGMVPNTIIIPLEVGEYFMEIPDIMARVKNTDDRLLTSGGLPQTIKGLRVVQPNMLKDSTVQGQSGINLSELWGDNIWVGYVDPLINTETPSFSKNFIYGERRFTVQRIPLPLKSTPDNAVYRIEVNQAGRDPKITLNTSGYLIRDLLG